MTVRNTTKKHIKNYNALWRLVIMWMEQKIVLGTETKRTKSELPFHRAQQILLLMDVPSLNSQHIH